MINSFKNSQLNKLFGVHNSLKSLLIAFLITIFTIPAVNALPTIGNLFVDSDGDGTPDFMDICPGHDDFLDSNANGIPDGCEEPDADGDGVSDILDRCPGYDDNLDVNGNGIPDGCESQDVASCTLYAVQDDNLNDSQLFTIDAETLTATNWGPLHSGKDIEALDIEPETNILYAASGDDTDTPGHLYTIDAGGQLVSLGDTGLNEIEALSFRPGDASLWAWAKGDGLVILNPLLPQDYQMIIPSEVKVEALTWNHDGSQLYAAQNTNLWVYDGEHIEKACNLPGHTEALEWFTEDTLLLGIHGQDALLQFKLLDLESCDLIEVVDIHTGYNDVEGIAWSCASDEPPPSNDDCIEDNSIALLQVAEAESYLASTRIDLEIDFAVNGHWPDSLDDIVHFDPANSLYIADMTINPDELYVEATFKTEAEGVDAAIAAKQVRFVYYPSEYRWDYDYIGFAKDCDAQMCTNPYEAVAEAFGLLWTPRTFVVEAYWSNDQWPATSELEDIGVMTASTYVEAVSSGAPELFIQAQLKEEGCIAPEVAGKTVRLTFDPTINRWQCSAGEPNGVPAEYLPADCR